MEELRQINYPSAPSPAWGFASAHDGCSGQVEIPFMYDFINSTWGRMSPNTIHCKNTQLTYFWCEQLMQRAMSVLKWKLPKEVNPYYFKWGINTFGVMGLFKHPKFGKCALVPALKDFDLYYYPKVMQFANKAFETLYEVEIATELNKDTDPEKKGILLNLRGNFTGFCSIVSFYADQLSLLFEDAGVSMVNMKLANVFGCENKNAAMSFRRMIDQIDSGNPSVFIDKNLYDEEGNPKWINFQSGMKNNYIIGDLLVDVRKIILLFDDAIGIPSINTEKRERMVTAEAEANQDEARSTIEMWLDDLKAECEKANQLLDFGISVDLRHKDDPVDYENKEQKGGSNLNEG